MKWPNPILNDVHIFFPYTFVLAKRLQVLPSHFGLPAKYNVNPPGGIFPRHAILTSTLNRKSFLPSSLPHNNTISGRHSEWLLPTKRLSFSIEIEREGNRWDKRWRRRLNSVQSAGKVWFQIAVRIYFYFSRIYQFQLKIWKYLKHCKSINRHYLKPQCQINRHKERRPKLLFFFKIQSKC